MNRLKNIKVLVLVALANLWLGMPLARACAVCFGAPGDKNTEAAGHAILFMLGMVGVVLAAIFITVVAFIWRANHRQKEHYNP